MPFFHQKGFKMKIKILVVFGSLCILFLYAFCIRTTESKKYNFLESTAAVQISSNSNNSHNASTVDTFLCTAVAFARDGNKYQFFTAAHCVADYNVETLKTVLKESVVYLTLEKQNGDKLVYEAKILAVGEMKNFEDLAILEAEIDEDIPIMVLSEHGHELDEDVKIVTVPSELGDIGLLQLRGYISREKITDLEMESINVQADGAFIVQSIGLGLGYGASGGGVLGIKNNEILGVVTGAAFNRLGHVSLIITPVAKFKIFYKEYTEGKRPLVKKEVVEPKQEEDQKTCDEATSCDLQK